MVKLIPNLKLILKLKKTTTNKQQKDGCFLSSNPSSAFVENGDVPVKNTVLPGIRSEGQEKQSWLKSRTESFCKPLGYCKRKTF